MAKATFLTYLSMGDMGDPIPVFKIDSIPNQPGKVVDGSTLLSLGVELPITPDHTTWIRQTKSKRRCDKCYYPLDGSEADWVRHKAIFHPSFQDTSKKFEVVY